MKPSVFNNPYQFSFKDLLAIAICAPFIGTVFLFIYHHNTNDLDLIKTLIPVVVVVLGGYFSQEVASSYFTRGNTGYGGYGYSTVASTAGSTPQETNQEGVV